jgi:hypothetical protein
MEGHLNGDGEKILVYLGPSLSLAKAREILPQAIYRPPARQGDIVTDVVNFSPNRIILIDAEFRQNLSPWHKEIVYALQYPGVKAVYGASSMGALRAAELDWLGMVGVGRVYEWYRDGVTEDDSEVALNYAARDALDGPIYYPLTVPLADIRAGVEHYEREFVDSPIPKLSRNYLERMKLVFYMDRTPSLCEQVWAETGATMPFPRIPQKAIDATHVLNDFREYRPAPVQKPSVDDLSGFFHALYERDRRIQVNGTEIPQQHIDAHVLLHNPEYERICWDAANQELALMFCNHLRLTISVEEAERESARFQQKSGVETPADFTKFLSANGWSRAEYDRLMIQNARIRKLQHTLTVSKAYRRNTEAILDYLRTHQGFDYWASAAVEMEKRIKASGVDDWMGINLETPAFALLAQHFEKEGLELKSLPEEYLLETGFSNLAELSVALERIAAGKEHDG